MKKYTVEINEEEIKFFIGCLKISIAAGEEHLKKGKVKTSVGVFMESVENEKQLLNKLRETLKQED